MRVLTINMDNISAAKKYIESLESWILSQSDRCNVMHKFLTGFGWYRNLQALHSNQLIEPDLTSTIEETHYFFSNLYIGQQVAVDTWNEFVGIQNYIVHHIQLDII